MAYRTSASECLVVRVAHARLRHPHSTPIETARSRRLAPNRRLAANPPSVALPAAEPCEQCLAKPYRAMSVSPHSATAQQSSTAPATRQAAATQPVPPTRNRLV